MEYDKKVEPCVYIGKLFLGIIYVCLSLNWVILNVLRMVAIY